MGGDEEGISEQGDCGANEKDYGNVDSEQGVCGANVKDDGDGDNEQGDCGANENDDGDYDNEHSEGIMEHHYGSQADKEQVEETKG